MNEQIPTPRTDAQFASICRRIDGEGNRYDEDHISADFARTLERELAASSSAAITNLTLATAIARYAQHRDWCPMPANDCTCGLDNLLNQL